MEKNFIQGKLKKYLKDIRVNILKYMSSQAILRFFLEVGLGFMTMSGQFRSCVKKVKNSLIMDNKIKKNCSHLKKKYNPGLET